MAERLNFGGRYVVDIDISFEIKKAYEKSTVTEMKNLYEASICNEIKELVDDNLGRMLEQSEFSVNVSALKNYFVIKEGAKE